MMTVTVTPESLPQDTRHSVRSVPGRSVVVYEVARGFSGGQEFATSINVANEGSVTGVTELGVQHAFGNN